MTNEEQQTIGLAATLQALHLVDELAFQGKTDNNQAETVLRALLVYSPDTVLMAYNNLSALNLGLGLLEKLLRNQSTDNRLARYLIPALMIEFKFIQDPDLLCTLQQGLSGLRNQLHNTEQEHAHDPISNTSDALLDNETVIKALANLYKQTFSTLEPRIMIQGDGNYLREDFYADRIRALLFAALRGIAFYRHYGGSRLRLLFAKRQILETLQQLKQS